MKHTPGPWERSDYGEVYSPSEGQTSIAMVLMRGEEGNANARLIAAAPEMFETLRIIAGERQCIDNLMSHADIARAMLAKINAV